MKLLYWRISLLIGISLFLAIITSHGLNISFDDINYYEYARQMLFGTFSISQSPYAYGFLYPATLALSMGIFGLSLQAAGYPQIVEFLALVLITYLLGKRHYNANIALLGALMVGMSAFVVTYAFRAIPDMLIGDLLALAMLAITYNTRKQFLFAGVLAGLIVFIKVGGLLYVPFLFIASALLPKPRSLMIYWFIGFVFLISIYFSIVSHYAPTLNVIASYSANQVHLSNASLAINFYDLYAYTFNYDSSAEGWAQIYPLGALFWIAILGSILMIKNRQRSLAPHYAFLWLTLLYFVFGTESLSSWTWIAVVSRYFIPLAPSMAMLAIYPANILYNRFESRFILSKKMLAFLICFLIIMIVILSNAPQLLYAISHNFNYVGAPIQNATQALQRNISTTR